MRRKTRKDSPKRRESLRLLLAGLGLTPRLENVRIYDILGAVWVGIDTRFYFTAAKASEMFGWVMEWHSEDYLDMMMSVNTLCLEFGELSELCRTAGNASLL